MTDLVLSFSSVVSTLVQQVTWSLNTVDNTTRQMTFNVEEEGG